MSFDAANHVLNDQILQNIASMMWEKEIISKYKNQYIISTVTKPTSFLNALRIDRKEDDVHLTPRGKNKTTDHPNITNFGHWISNQDTLKKRPQEEFEPNEAVSKSLFILTDVFMCYSHHPSLITCALKKSTHMVSSCTKIKFTTNRQSWKLIKTSTFIMLCARGSTLE